MNYVVATAGHVDHGKSLLVRALTGIEPDRWEEEQRRGLTIDLGFAWSTLPSGKSVAFVDVPGHEKFLGNMLAGVGPAPAVMLIVAADEGWREQTADHLAAVDGFGLEYGVIAMTRCDLADASQRARTRADIVDKLRGTSLENAPIVEVSARTQEGLDALRETLESVLESAPAPDASSPVRLWIDRSFHITGAGTVVTGTLTAGTIHAGDRFRCGERQVQVRSLQSQEHGVAEVGPAARVALNLRDIDTSAIGRGDVLTAEDEFWWSSLLDVRVHRDALSQRPPQEVVVHMGTAEIMARVRYFGPNHLRLALARPIPARVGERMVLRKPGQRSMYAGISVMDVDPPELTQRGAATQRDKDLGQLPVGGSVAAEVSRREAMPIQDLRSMGFPLAEKAPAGCVEFRGWYVHAPAVMRWKDELLKAIDAQRERDPLSPGLTRGAALGVLNLPGADLFALVVAAAKVEETDGVLRRPGQKVNLGEHEEAVARLEQRWQKEPLWSPEAKELAGFGLSAQALAAAERAGRLLRLGDIVVSVEAPAAAAKALRGIEQPFTTSQARQAMGLTRRVVIPLLEHLDRTGVTQRLDGSQRRLR
ncbi:selenocysteine-specific translation elongation factor [Corynebacterium tapiri]|uniref:Selenocysteine-specific translation elongation factor n=1 Tax=Corynebacterium tapiri TaxID=1448266 RepID=A0A5C4U812_9CORY|nr:selenocysteine-specific translation elongation factor [Corynebacterium tapiri]TNM00540.1 selenocysteine-specific translation elongation factor [Corynebacterium tapiri]